MNIVTKQALMLDFLGYYTGTTQREIKECHMNFRECGEYTFVRVRDDFEAHVIALESHTDVQYVRLNEDVYGKIPGGQWQKLLTWYM